MKRSRLLNMFLKYKTETNRKTTKLRGTFAKSFSKPLKNHTSTLSIRKKNKNTDNRAIWKTTLPHFTQKVKKFVKKVNVTSGDEEICSTIVLQFFTYTDYWTFSLKFTKYQCRSYTGYSWLIWQIRKYWINKNEVMQFDG